MLNRLKMKNFRQHTDMEVVFTAGLNTILGSNESGKSTLLEAIFYALFGTEMLRESIAEVVAYDCPVASLRVELDITLDGMQYSIYRTQASAEIRYADQIVTGQRATKQFMENLFGCTTDLVKRLMFANQESVKGVIGDGDRNAAGGMVEKLADLEVIDDIIERIQTHLPSGNTKVLSAQLDQLQSNKLELPDLPKNEAVLQASERLARANTHYEKLKPKKAEFATKLGALKQELKRAVEASISKKTALARKSELEAQAKPPTPLAFTQADLDAARKLAYNAAEAARMRKALAIKFPTHAQEWDGSEASFQAEIEGARIGLSAYANNKQTLRDRIVAIKATAINEDVCAFCKKDISQLPEVAIQNDKVKAEVEELEAALVVLNLNIKQTTSQLQILQELEAVTKECRRLADPEYWWLSDTIPPKATWIGGEVPPVGDIPDHVAMEKQWQAYTVAKTRAEAAQEQLAALVIPEGADTASLEAEIFECEVLLDGIKTSEDEIGKAQQALKYEQAAYDQALSMYEIQKSHIENHESSIAKMLSDIAETEKSNALIRKLRDTRPAIAAELWGIVLGGISHYFTKMRGTDSVVTRDTDGFRVNGRSVSGLSGSTQDALGLAVRVALTRTFLPNVPLLVLDEPFHGCDKTREMAGLQLIANTGFEQTLLVTHSDLADTLSDNVLSL